MYFGLADNFSLHTLTGILHEINVQFRKYFFIICFVLFAACHINMIVQCFSQCIVYICNLTNIFAFQCFNLNKFIGYSNSSLMEEASLIDIDNNTFWSGNEYVFLKQCFPIFLSSQGPRRNYFTMVQLTFPCHFKIKSFLNISVLRTCRLGLFVMQKKMLKLSKNVNFLGDIPLSLSLTHPPSQIEQKYESVILFSRLHCALGTITISALLTSLDLLLQVPIEKWDGVLVGFGSPTPMQSCQLLVADH